MKKGKLGIVFYLLICFNVLISAQFVESNSVLDWEVKQTGLAKSIGVDDENNLLLFYHGADDDLTKTWLIKYSTSGDVIYNNSLDFGYDYFLYTQKWMDFAGKLYLVGISTENINIYIFNNDLTLRNHLFINESDFDGILTLSDIFVTNVGNIYLRTTYYSSLYNSTHLEKKDHLIKIDAEANFLWTLNFHAYTTPSAGIVDFVSEYDQDYCYFSYQNILYKIKSSNGRIVWEKEFPQNIKKIATAINGIAIVFEEGSKYVPLSFEYLSTKGALKWSKTVSTDYGYLSLKNVEIKKYSVGFSITDLGDDGETGDGADIIVIYNLDGDDLLNKKWEYEGPYLFERKTFHLTTNNSVFVHYNYYPDLPDGSTYIRHYSFENNMTTITPANGSSIELIIYYVIIVVVTARQNFRKQLKTS